MNKVYVLYLEMYGDWASENGACDLIGVYSNIDSADKKLKEYLKNDLENDFIIDDRKDYASIYANKYDYDNGYESGIYYIVEKTIQD